MTIYRPELLNAAELPGIPLKLTNPKHLASSPENFLRLGKNISELGDKIGAEGLTRSGTFEDVMLNALDKVSAAQQLSSDLAQAAITDPESVDVQDITIAQAKAGMSLNIARTVLTRLVQGWRDLINTR
jgi:flagellar hook-basal body complex protein FliE